MYVQPIVFYTVIIYLCMLFSVNFSGQSVLIVVPVSDGVYGFNKAIVLYSWRFVLPYQHTILHTCSTGLTVTLVTKQGQSTSAVSIIEFGLRVYSTRYTEHNTEINIEGPQ